MEMYGKIRCVTFPELVSQGRILSKPNYDKKVREGKIRVVRPGKGAGSYALIDYQSSRPYSRGIRQTLSQCFGRNERTINE